MSLIQNIFILGRKYSQEQNILDDFLKENKAKFDTVLKNIDSTQYSSLFQLSTCNRFEIIGKGNLKFVLKSLTESIPLFHEIESTFYYKEGEDAINHIFSMSSGLDSSVLGDIEILGQFKNACILAKKDNRICNFMERLINISLQSSKEIRQKTGITNGTTSLSYASIQILKNRNLEAQKSILLIGLGKFGKSIARNLKQYFPNNSLYLVNRTIEKSIQLSKELNCFYFDYEDLPTKLEDFDVIISAIGSQEEKNRSLLNTDKQKIIIDLSVPLFFSAEIVANTNIDLINITEASNIINNSISKRESSIPKAWKIIDKYRLEFLEWVLINETYLKGWKKKIKEVSQECEEFTHFEKKETDTILNKSIGDFVVHVKNNRNSFESKELILNFVDNNLKNNCLIHKYSNVSINHNCNKCQNKYA